jgi:hypothetical protein
MAGPRFFSILLFRVTFVMGISAKMDLPSFEEVSIKSTMIPLKTLASEHNTPLSIAVPSKQKHCINIDYA